jgi:putative transposase
MSSFRQVYYQIVFGTKNWESTIAEAHCGELYQYIWGIVKNKQCLLHRINGVEDHIHIFSDLHPSIALSDFVRDIKVASSLWMKTNGKFPNFHGWQDGYGAFTYNLRDRDMIINYVKNQKEHHKTETSKDEFRRLLSENGIEFDEKYLF